MLGLLRKLSPIAPSFSRRSISQLSTRQQYAFEPLIPKIVYPPSVSSNQAYYDAFITEVKERRGPKIEKLKFKGTGAGETPSSARRAPNKTLRAEVLVRRERIPASPKRMTPLCRLIRRMTVDEALDQLRYSPRRWGKEIMQVLHEGVKLAKLKHNLEQRDLYVACCYVTRGQIVKGIMYHSKGRFGQKRKAKSHLNIILRDLAGKPVEAYQLVARKLVKPKQDLQTPPQPLDVVLKHL